MKRLLRRSIISAMVVTITIVMLFIYLMQSKNAQIRMIERSYGTFAQIIQTIERNEIEMKNLKESLSEDYLTRVSAFAYIIEQNPDVLESLDELNKIKELLNVDELHVIDENGYLMWGTIPKYYGMDFASTEQTKEFLQILEDPSIKLVQDVRPNGAEKKMFQYVGIARQDKPGIVEIGLAPTRWLEASRQNELSYIFSRIPVDKGCSLFAVHDETWKIEAHSNSELIDENIQDMGFPIDKVCTEGEGFFHIFQGAKKYYTFQKCGDLYLGIGQEESVLYEERNRQIKQVAVCLIVMIVLVAFVLNWLVQEKIIKGVFKIIDKLNQITQGNLDTVVDIEDNPEFKKLSTEINKMVVNILESTTRLSWIFEMTDVPIGVFECREDMHRVLVTSKLNKILLWDDDKAESYYRDKNLFAKEMDRLIESALESDKNTYKINENPPKWIKVHKMDQENVSIGIVHDITEEMQEKLKIKYERDHDALTGLCNRRHFKERVNNILNDKDIIKISAMVMLDLDHFKDINDKYGHDWGDIYLQSTAEALSTVPKDHSVTSRRSGDEFCLFLYGYDSKDEIRNEMKRFYDYMEENKIHFPDGECKPMKVSAGLAWYSKGISDYESLLRLADSVLYEVKNKRKGYYYEGNIV